VAVAQSPILITTITLKRLMQKGYVPMLDIYKRISPQLNEPLYTCLSGRQARPAWFTLSVAEVSSCVRGALAVTWPSVTYSITSWAFVLFVF